MRVSGSVRWRAALLLASVGLSVLAVLWLGTPHNSFDLRVYRGAVDSWVHGHDLYAYGLGDRHLGFTYPPFAALCMVPMLLLPPAVLTVVNALVILTAGLLVVRAVVARLPSFAGSDSRNPWYVAALLTPPLFVLQPMRDTLSFGQVNIALAALVTLDLLLLERGNRWAGAGAGLATALKLTPGLFVVLYLVAGSWRTARTAVLVAAGVTGLAALLAPGTSWTYWTSALFDSSRVGSYDSATNQSLGGLLARLANSSDLPAWWLPLVAVVVLAALRSARRLFRAGALLPAYTVVGLTAAVASPISWVHHLWWVAPALLLLLDRGRRERSVALVGCVAGGYLLLCSGVNDALRAPAGQHLRDVGTVLGENAYAGVLLLLLVLVCRTPSARKASPVRETPSVGERA